MWKDWGKIKYMYGSHLWVGNIDNLKIISPGLLYTTTLNHLPNCSCHQIMIYPTCPVDVPSVYQYSLLSPVRCRSQATFTSWMTHLPPSSPEPLPAGSEFPPDVSAAPSLSPAAPSCSGACRSSCCRSRCRCTSLGCTCLHPPSGWLQVLACLGLRSRRQNEKVTKYKGFVHLLQYFFIPALTSTLTHYIGGQISALFTPNATEKKDFYLLHWERYSDTFQL